MFLNNSTYLNFILMEIQLMLNSEELEELKILAVSQKEQSFPNITHIVTSSSNIQLMGKDPNANIRSFYCILLTHIFGTHLETDPTNHQLNQKNEASSDAQYKLYRIKHLLYSRDIKLNQIKNTPQSLERVLSEQFFSNKKVYESNQEDQPANFSANNQTHSLLEKSWYKNLYMKKLITELLTLLWRECSKISSHSSREDSSAKIQSLRNEQIFKFLQEFGVADCLLCTFIREVLYKEYDIRLAADFNQKIPDHTVYTALCDAFGYNGLKLEQNECQISNDSIIYSYPILESHRQTVMNHSTTNKIESNFQKYYLISLPDLNPSSHNTSENIQFQTFRNRRKASRDLKLGDQNQISMSDNSFAKKESGGIRSSSSSLSVKERRDVRFFSQSVDGEFWSCDKIEKEMSKQFECPYLEEQGQKVRTPSGRNKPYIPQINTTGINENETEYSSLSLIMQLSPRVREAMLKSPMFRKKV